MTKKITNLMLNGENYEIREYVEPGWQPGANTYGYYPLNGDLNDYSGNNRNLTGIGVTYTSGGPGQVGVFSSGATAYYNNSNLNSWTAYTYSVFAQTTNVPTGYKLSGYPYHTAAVVICDNDNIDSYGRILGFGLGGAISQEYYGVMHFANGGSTNINTWYHLVSTRDGSTLKTYLNGSFVGSTSLPGISSTSNASLRIAFQRNISDAIAFNGKLSNVIIEDKERTAQEVSDYYNQIKSLYGIS